MGFGKPEDYEGFLVKPTKFVDEQLLIDEADNIKRIMASFLTGHVAPHIILQKMGEQAYTSKTKTALMQYNNLIKSRHILRTIHDPHYRHAIEKALNRGESYNNLYRGITLLNDGALRGKSEIEMEIWHQCTRLIAAIIHYHNTYILNTLYQQATSDEEKEFLKKLSPTAWSHVLLLGFFQFYAVCKFFAQII
jgi:TnpA family transposase